MPARVASQQRLPVVGGAQGNSGQASYAQTIFPVRRSSSLSQATSNPSSSPSRRQTSQISTAVAGSTSAAASQASSQPTTTTQRPVFSYHAVRDFVRKTCELLRAVIATLIFIATVLSVWPAFLGALESKKATRIAQWTAKKDFLDICESHDWEPKGCLEAKGIELGPPPGFDTTDWKRWDHPLGYEESYNDHATSPSTLQAVFYLYIAPLVPSYAAYVLLTPTHRRMAWYYLLSLCRGLMKTIGFLLRHVILLLQRPAYDDDDDDYVYEESGMLPKFAQDCNDYSSPDICRQKPKLQWWNRWVHRMSNTNDEFPFEREEGKLERPETGLDEHIDTTELEEANIYQTNLKGEEERREASLEEEPHETGLQERRHGLGSSVESSDVDVIPERFTTKQKDDHEELSTSTGIDGNIGSLRRREPLAHSFFDTTFTRYVSIVSYVRKQYPK